MLYYLYDFPKFIFQRRQLPYNIKTNAELVPTVENTISGLKSNIEKRVNGTYAHLVKIIHHHDKIADDHSKIVHYHEKIIDDHWKIVYLHEKIADDHLKIDHHHEKIIDDHSKIVHHHDKIVDDHKKSNVERSKVKSFENKFKEALWLRSKGLEKSTELTKAISETTRNTEFARDNDLRDQIRRAAISIISNISEGFERRSDKEFQYFLSVAEGSSFNFNYYPFR